jgi:hypothetical protein
LSDKLPDPFFCFFSHFTAAFPFGCVYTGVGDEAPLTEKKETAAH